MDDLTAIVLCGGKGERLRPFTEHAPKPLAPLGGKPILQHLLQYLEEAGVRRFVLCVGYRSQMIRDFLAATYADRDRFVCVDSGDVSMTDRLVGARAHVAGRALVCYGDTLANVRLTELLSFHEAHQSPATLTIHPMRSPFGIVELGAENSVVRFQEKPLLPYWVNIGYLVLEPTLLQALQPGSDMPDFLDSLAVARKLRAYRHEGGHLTVNTEKERAHAETRVAEMLTVP